MIDREEWKRRACRRCSIRAKCDQEDSTIQQCQREVLGTQEPLRTKREMKKQEKIVYGQPYSRPLQNGVLLVFPGVLPPGLNEIKRMNPFEYSRLKKTWMWLIKGAMGRNTQHFPRARIEMFMHRIGKMDRDNTEACFKIPGDALRDLRVIPDDSDEYIDTKIENVPVKRNQRSEIRTEILITRQT